MGMRQGYHVISPPEGRSVVARGYACIFKKAFFNYFFKRGWVKGDLCQVVTDENVMTQRPEAKSKDQRPHMTSRSTFYSKAFLSSEDAAGLVQKVLQCSKSLCESLALISTLDYVLKLSKKHTPGRGGIPIPLNWIANCGAMRLNCAA